MRDNEECLFVHYRAVRILDPATCSDAAESLQKLLESRLKCYNNMAACQLKVSISRCFHTGSYPEA